MKRIYTYGGRPTRRNLTVADMIALKGKVTLCQTCPANEEEATACAEVGSVSMLPREHEKLLEAFDVRPVFSR